MNIGARLEAIGSMVPAGCVLADIGTDHAYLPVHLIKAGRIARAIAGDIAEGPCAAARTTIGMHGVRQQVEVRLGSGLKVLGTGEAGCIAIAGMGASTIIDILAADLEIARAAQRLVLQPMTGAASLRRWLVANGWQLADEALAEEGGHLYEIIAAEPCNDAKRKEYSDAEYEIGPLLLAKGGGLLAKQFAKQIANCETLLHNMEKSSQAKASSKYAAAAAMLRALEVLADEYLRK